MEQPNFDERWLERQAELMAKINDYGTTTKFGSFLFVVATGGLFKALLSKVLLMFMPRAMRLKLARSRMEVGRRSFVQAITVEPRATMPVYMTVTSIYTFLVGNDHEVLKESIDELYRVVRQARWQRANAGEDTCDLDHLIESYLSDDP